MSMTNGQGSRRLVLGTRGSKLALAQSGQTAAAISAATGVEVRLEVISTRGDRIIDRPLAEVGGKGLFTAELEAALRDGSIDLAVHSLKDLPTELPDDLVLGCVPLRADARDALVGPSLDELASGAVVGTGSLRRLAQLRALRPDLDVRGIRGNIDTRLRKRDDGDYDAIVLAMAGIARLQVQRGDVRPFEVEQMLPAVGQGALGVQVRASDADLRELLAAVHDPATARCVEAERSFLAALGGGCNVPAGCYVIIDGDALLGRAVVERDEVLHGAELRGSDGVELGRELASTTAGA